MKKRKPKIIADKKQRGEWAESVFMARANEHGLPVSKPWGELSSYDFVIGKTGRFVSVQVKSTLSKEKTGYVCTVRGGHQAYAAGSREPGAHATLGKGLTSARIARISTDLFGARRKPCLSWFWTSLDPRRSVQSVA